MVSLVIQVQIVFILIDITTTIALVLIILKVHHIILGLTSKISLMNTTLGGDLITYQQL